MLGSVLLYCNVGAKKKLILKVLKSLKLCDIRNQPSYSAKTEGM